MGAQFQNSNQETGGKIQGSGSRTPGTQEGILADSGEESGDGDPRADKLGNLPKKWASLFGVKPSGKSSFPPVKVVSGLEKGSCTIAIPDEIVDHSIASMASTLVRKFIGLRPNIDVVRAFTSKKWSLKGQVSVTAMAKGFLSFNFTCQEDMADILCEGP